MPVLNSQLDLGSHSQILGVTETLQSKVIPMVVAVEGLLHSFSTAVGQITSS